MGAKDSKPSFIAYEDAVKRVPDSELRRIREAFKRCAGANGTTLSLEAFVHEVLSDGVPFEVAEWLYQACGGTKRGLAFRDLLCGLVVLTKGNLEEKIKFLWTLYVNNSSDNGTYIYKRDFSRALHLENTTLPVTEVHKSAEILTSLFGLGDRVTFEQFRSWLLIRKDATVLSKWLLSDRTKVAQDLETPTFYQSLAGVTHLEERDIIELEKCFWSLRNSAPTGQLDAESLTPLLSPPLPRAAVAGVFLAFDENRDGHIDFKELCCGLSAACRGPRTERLKFCFKIFDLDRDRVLNKKELTDMVAILCAVANESLKNNSRASTPSDGPESEGTEKGFDPDSVLLNLRDKMVTTPRQKPIFQLGPGGETEIKVNAEETSVQETDTDSIIPEDTALPLEDFLIWSVENAGALVTPFLELVMEVCHIVLGLRPQCRHQERDVVLGWLRREVSRGYSVGQFWYLIGAEWWNSWSAYCASQPNATCCRDTRSVPIDEACVCDDSFTTNSTESMGSLLWRAETASLGSAGSSSGVSSAPAGRQNNHPGPIDNKRLLAPNHLKVSHVSESMGSLLWRAETASLGSAGSISGVSSAPAGRQNNHPGPIDNKRLLAPNHLKVSHVSESMGSLLWRAETASLGSAGSISGVSSAPAGRQNNHPGPIDNKRLLAPNHLKVRTLTGEGGHLRRDITLAQHRDFELVPDALWRALALWYGGADPLPRQVIRPPNSDVELELYPLHLKLLRHVTSPHRLSTVAAVGGASVSLYSSVPAPPERQLAYTAAFSRLATVKQVSEFLCQALGLAREDMRLWLLGSTNVLLDDERPTLTELGLDERSRLLVEVRNADLTWPEEIHALSMSGGTGGNRASARRETLSAPNLPGATGLHNLGNTCFMNAALQAVWNTAPLTKYFNSGTHLYELNTVNPLGTKGALALRYGELCKEVWSCNARSVAPLRVRWCVSRYARHLAHGQQHDAQELLAWLLDTLHEDLNRAQQTPPRAEMPDSDGRPDQVVAQEAWESFSCRNQSIMTDLFYGQLKSKVTCTACGHESVRFDTFNMLSLPLPMESYVRADLKVMLLDGSVPIKYGVRVNSEGTCLDLKNKLSELCGLPPHLMLLVELSGATIGRVLEDKTRLATVAVAALCVYEIPSVDEEDSSDGECDSACAWEAATVGSPEVSAPQPSLCMPALFCFKRSRSETVMSQSPPNTFHTNHDGRSHTLPRDLSDLKRKDANGNSSPTLSVKSLNLKPTSQPLNHVKFNSSPSNMDRMNDAPARIQYLVAVHRKQCRSDAYFLPSQRCAPVLFGVPILVGIRRGMSGQQLYAEVWQQVSRLLSARPAPAQHAPPNNHAHDCDDSLGYEFPFTLRLVSSNGAWCGACSWDALCRGCALRSDAPALFTSESTPRPRKRSSVHRSPPGCAAADGTLDCSSPVARAKMDRLHGARLSVDCNGEVFGELKRLDLSVLRQAYRRGRGVMLAIDWDPTALHLRYQSTREKAFIEHPSVSQCLAEAAKPIDLGSCLTAFTSEELLEARYQCAKCAGRQPATKKLQIWRAPPIMIIHLKRFQYMNNKWIKSQKVVNFPLQDFDPSEYLAAVPQETLRRYKEISRRRSSMFIDETISESEEDSDMESDMEPKTDDHHSRPAERTRINTRRERIQSTSLAATPVTDDNLIDYHQHHLLRNHNAFDLKYRLYAVVSHSGQLSGGHYVAYARNPSGAWLSYNDSSCRALPAPRLDPAAAYLLFYERQHLDTDKYLPDVSNREPVMKDTDTLDPDEADLKKCVIQ